MVKKKILIIIALVIVIVLIGGFGVVIINTNNKLTTTEQKYSDSKKQIESYKNTVSEKENELQDLNSKNENNDNTIQSYKNKLAKKNKEIKQLKEKVSKLNKEFGKKKERENKVATVGEYTNDSGNISVTVNFAEINKISFDYQLKYSSSYIAGFKCDNVSLSEGKGTFTYDNMDEKGNGTIEVVDSKTIRYYVNCTYNETVRGYSSACEPTILHLN